MALKISHSELETRSNLRDVSRGKLSRFRRLSSTMSDSFLELQSNATNSREVRLPLNAPTRLESDAGGAHSAASERSIMLDALVATTDDDKDGDESEELRVPPTSIVVKVGLWPRLFVDFIGPRYFTAELDCLAEHLEARLCKPVTANEYTNERRLFRQLLSYAKQQWHTASLVRVLEHASFGALFKCVGESLPDNTLQRAMLLPVLTTALTVSLLQLHCGTVNEQTMSLQRFVNAALELIGGDTDDDVGNVVFDDDTWRETAAVENHWDYDRKWCWTALAGAKWFFDNAKPLGTPNLLNRPPFTSAMKMLLPSERLVVEYLQQNAPASLVCKVVSTVARTRNTLVEALQKELQEKLSITNARAGCDERFVESLWYIALFVPLRRAAVYLHVTTTEHSLPTLKFAFARIAWRLLMQLYVNWCEHLEWRVVGLQQRVVCVRAVPARPVVVDEPVPPAAPLLKSSVCNDMLETAPGDEAVARLWKLQSIRIGDLNLKWEHLACLEPGKWLNSSVIDGVVECVRLRQSDALKRRGVEILQTHYYKRFSSSSTADIDRHFAKYRLLKDLPKRIRERSVRRLLMPANINENHWILIQLDFVNGTIDWYDPLGLNSVSKQALATLGRVLEKLDKASFHRRQHWFILPLYEPLQSDMSSCGVFVCAVLCKLAVCGELSTLPDAKCIERDYRERIGVMLMNCASSQITSSNDVTETPMTTTTTTITSQVVSVSSNAELPNLDSDYASVDANAAATNISVAYSLGAVAVSVATPGVVENVTLPTDDNVLLSGAPSLVATTVPAEADMAVLLLHAGSQISAVLFGDSDENHAPAPPSIFGAEPATLLFDGSDENDASAPAPVFGAQPATPTEDIMAEATAPTPTTSNHSTREGDASDAAPTTHASMSSTAPTLASTPNENQTATNLVLDESNLEQLRLPVDEHKKKMTRKRGRLSAPLMSTTRTLSEPANRVAARATDRSPTSSKSVVSPANTSTRVAALTAGGARSESDDDDVVETIANDLESAEPGDDGNDSDSCSAKSRRVADVFGGLMVGADVAFLPVMEALVNTFSAGTTMSRDDVVRALSTLIDVVPLLQQNTAALRSLLCKLKEMLTARRRKTKKLNWNAIRRCLTMVCWLCEYSSALRDELWADVDNRKLLSDKAEAVDMLDNNDFGALKLSLEVGERSDIVGAGAARVGDDVFLLSSIAAARLASSQSNVDAAATDLANRLERPELLGQLHVQIPLGRMLLYSGLLSDVRAGTVNVNKTDWNNIDPRESGVYEMATELLTILVRVKARWYRAAAERAGGVREVDEVVAMTIN
jgi:hypothetical protein